MRTSVYALITLLTVTVCAETPAQTVFSRLTPERLWQMVRAGDPQVSPDGRWVAFTVTAFGPDATLPSVDIWLVDSQGDDEPRQLTRSPGADFDPAWAPDSRSIAYAGVPDNSSHSQIFLLNLRGGAPQPLTDLPTSAKRPRFSQDGKTVLFQAATYPSLGTEPGPWRDAMEQSRLQRQHAYATESRLAGSSQADPNQIQHVYRLDLASGELMDLTPEALNTGNVSLFHWDVSPGGRLLAYTANVSAAPYLTRNADVFLTDLNTGETQNLTADNKAEDTRPVFSADGSHLLYATRTHPDALDEFRTLVAYELRSGQKKAVTDPQQLSPEQWLTSADGRLVYFVAQDRGRRRVFRTGISGGKARGLTGAGSYSDLTMDGVGNLFARHESLLMPPTLYRMDVNGRHAAALTRFNAAYQENTRQPETGEMTFTTGDGQSVHALVVYPPGWQETVRWPVIVALHGGPHSAWLDEFNWRWSLALMASEGYLVVAPNVRGSTGYGQDFASAINGNPLALAGADVMAVAAGIKSLPYVNDRQIAVVGGSFGGMLALWVLGETSLFSVAAVHAPVFDQAMIGASDFLWGRTRTWGRPPWLALQAGSSAALPDSPSQRVSRIKTPVLALHGVDDQRVPAAQSRLLHNQLLDLNVASRLVLLPGQGHVVSHPPAAQAWWGELFGWLQRHQGQ